MKLAFSYLIFIGLAAEVLGQSYWYEWIAHRGVAPYNSQGTAYQVYRNVKDFGAKGSFLSAFRDPADSGR
jgi:glucan 1,3-beta-glucosidase